MHGVRSAIGGNQVDAHFAQSLSATKSIVSPSCLLRVGVRQIAEGVHGGGVLRS